MIETDRRQLPDFENEAEEARWWFGNRHKVAEEFGQAINEGRITQGAMVRRGLARTHTIELDSDDLTHAQTLAEKKGMRYQTYLRILIHEALERERNEVAS